MINFVSMFDAYGRQARLYPGLLTLFPPLLTVIAWFPALITSSIGATLLTIASSCGLLYGLAVVSRTQGKRVEKRLFRKWGGWPTTIWLRHEGGYLQPQTLDRYHRFLAANVPGLALPTSEEEKQDRSKSDSACASGVKWLQEHCRGSKFPLVEKENAEYGFRRNLLGMRPIGLTTTFFALGISLLAVIDAHRDLGLAPCGFILEQIWRVIEGLPPTVIAVTIMDILAIVGWLAIVRSQWVRDAGDQYARALLASCDNPSIPGGKLQPTAKRTRRSGKSQRTAADSDEEH
jgi:hypothetical protein